MRGLMSLSDSPEFEDYLHLKPRYVFEEARAIFGVHAKTLRAWMKRGVPLPNGQRVRLPYIPIGMRKTFFFQEDVHRIAALRCRAVAGGGELVSFPGPGERSRRKRTPVDRPPTAARILPWRV